MIRTLVLTAAALACTAALAAPPGYIQIKPTKYCSPRGDSDPDMMIKGCKDSINTGLLSHDELAGAWSNLALAYMRKGDNDGAIHAFGSALSADPDQWFVYVNRGGLYARAGKVDLAQADFDKALSLHPNEPAALRARGEYYIDMRKYDLAVADLTAALARNDRDAKAYGYRARAYEAEGKTDLAASDRAQLAALDPDNTLGLMPSQGKP